MLCRLLSFVAVYGALAQAWTSTSFSYKTEISCSTEYDSGGKQPTPLPSVTYTRSTILSSMGSVAFQQIASRVTVSVVTTTVLTSTEVVATTQTDFIPTSTSYSYTISTVATAVYPDTVCTNGVVPSTVTEYPGTYVPVSGQVTALPATYPVRLVCTKSENTFWVMHPIETTTIISSVTATTILWEPTTTVTQEVNFGDTETVYGATVFTTVTSYTVATSVAVISTACQATTTTTYAAKCAPTNIIGAINGVGLVSGSYADNTTITYGPRGDSPYTEDPSLCCQLCQDNKGCAGVMSGGSGFCGLLYIGGPGGAPKCEKIFTYGTQKSTIPGAGLLVQSGCGSIAYEG